MRGTFTGVLVAGMLAAGAHSALSGRVPALTYVVTVTGTRTMVWTANQTVSAGGNCTTGFSGRGMESATFSVEPTRVTVSVDPNLPRNQTPRSPKIRVEGRRDGTLMVERGGTGDCLHDTSVASTTGCGSASGVDHDETQAWFQPGFVVGADLHGRRLREPQVWTQLEVRFTPLRKLHPCPGGSDSVEDPSQVLGISYGDDRPGPGATIHGSQINLSVSFRFNDARRNKTWSLAGRHTLKTPITAGPGRPVRVGLASVTVTWKAVYKRLS